MIIFLWLYWCVKSIGCAKLMFSFTLYSEKDINYSADVPMIYICQFASSFTFIWGHFFVSFRSEIWKNWGADPEWTVQNSKVFFTHESYIVFAVASFSDSSCYSGFSSKTAPPFLPAMRLSCEWMNGTLTEWYYHAVAVIVVLLLLLFRTEPPQRTAL